MKVSFAAHLELIVNYYLMNFWILWSSPWQDIAGLALIHLMDKDLHTTLTYTQSVAFDKTLELIFSSTLGEALLDLVLPAEIHNFEGDLVNDFSRYEVFYYEYDDIEKLEKLCANIKEEKNSNSLDWRLYWARFYRCCLKLNSGNCLRSKWILVQSSMNLWINMPIVRSLLYGWTSADLKSHFEELELHGINLEKITDVALSLFGYC